MGTLLGWVPRKWLQENWGPHGVVAVLASLPQAQASRDKEMW